MQATLVDHMGDDITVVNAARVSFNKESDWQYKEVKIDCDSNFVSTYGPGLGLSEKDNKLLTYLAKHGHWTPFAHPQVMLHLKMPLFVARQIDKHQVGFVVNEISRRYVDYEPEFFEPEVWRKKADNKKQGSTDERVRLFETNYFDNRYWTGPDDEYSDFLYTVKNLYKDMLAGGICPEQARMILPQSMYTEQYKTGSLYGWFNLCKLRTSPDAQKETQELALQIEEILLKLYPYSWKALKNEATEEN